MGEKDENRQVLERTKASKELLYSDYIATSVTEHAFGFLERNDQSSAKMEIIHKKGKSGALERGKRLLSIVDDGQNGNCQQIMSTDNEVAVDVELMINDDGSEYKADAFFTLPLSQTEHYDDDDNYGNSSAPNFLEFDDDSSDCSDSSDSSNDGDSWLDFSSRSRRKNMIEVIDGNDCLADGGNKNELLNVAENDSSSIPENGSSSIPENESSSHKPSKDVFVSVGMKSLIEDSSNSDGEREHTKSLSSSDEEKYSNEKDKYLGVSENELSEFAKDASSAVVSTANEVRDNHDNKGLEFSSIDSQQTFSCAMTNKRKLIDVMGSEFCRRPCESPLRKCRRH